MLPSPVLSVGKRAKVAANEASSFKTRIASARKKKYVDQDGERRRKGRSNSLIIQSSLLKPGLVLGVGSGLDDELNACR